MRKALSGLSRFVAVGAQGKRMLIAWQDCWTLGSNANMIFAFDDDYSMGILLPRAHDAWAWARPSTLKGDLRYTPTTAFMTFPWPDPVAPVPREAVVAAYGWPKSAAQDPDELVNRVTELNREITEGSRDYNPFAGN